MSSKKNIQDKPDISIENMLHRFRAEYELSLRQLAALLDDAGISHYSSGCGNKHVTFDLFPASSYVETFLTLLTVDRSLRAELSGGFKDAQGDYNPGHDFVLYLRRWGLFAEQVMRTEGDTPRGIAAAKAKLLLDELSTTLGENKIGSALKTANIVALMRIVAAKIETRQKMEDSEHKTPRKLRGHHNYLKALAAAQKQKEARERISS